VNLARAALHRPFTVLVAVVALGLASIAAWREMPKDILPTLDLPTIYVAQAYGGMDPAQMEGYLVYFFEYHFLYITGIEHVESKSIQGAALMKLQFHPGTEMSQAMAETVAFVNRARAFMPPGTMPPLITRFDPGSAPVGYLVFASDTRSVTEMQDAAVNRVRPLLATLPGVSAPPPFGGNARTIVVNLKPERLKSYRMSPDEAVTAIAAANVVSPSGNLMMQGKYPMAPVNSVPRNIKDLEGAAIRGGEYPAIFVRDVAEVVDDSDIVTCYALVNGRRTVYVPITKRAGASSLAVARLAKESIPKFQNVLPPDMRVSYEMDRSPFVKRALAGVLWEALAGAAMTGVVVLLFLRNWRSAMVVVLNVPIALMAAVLALWLCGETLNLMTLGGLALAVGILVDESIVALENIHARARETRSAGHSVLEASTETAGPRLLSMLCVLVMFTPALFMEGAIKAMFLPFSLAVGFAVAASYLLSSTLVPVLAVWASPTRSLNRFQILPARYSESLRKIAPARTVIIVSYLVGAGAIGLLLGSKLGKEPVPKVDSGELRVRLRAPAGTDIDGTEKAFLKTLSIVENAVGPKNIESSLGFVGLHGSMYPINFLYAWNGGPEEGVLDLKLKSTARLRGEPLKEQLRRDFARELPDASLSFEAADILSQVMSLGAEAPIEVAVSGPSLANDRLVAERVKDRLEHISTLRDVQFAQSFDYPTVEVTVDRVRSGVIGPDMTHVSRALVPSTWSSRFASPNFWADPKSGIGYQVQTEIPQPSVRTIEQLRNVPIAEVKGRAVLLRDVARVREGTTVSEYDRRNMQRTIHVRANVAGEALSSAAVRVRDALRELGPIPARVNVVMSGQIVPMLGMQASLARGLGIAVIAIVLLLLANFQSLRLSLVVITVVPAVLAGAVLALWLTRTTLNIQSFIGAIMSVSVALANAILLVTFAERSRIAGATSFDAALEGARSRLRPILMTSVAMLAGMLPVALGLGDQTGYMAPLGRAVIGGLVAGTLGTLGVLPLVFALVQARSHRRGVSLI
jgi:multidrug efflux pump subunit AcrB